jgi:hypothetical protein
MNRIKMIKWKRICESRCAIDSCYDWINNNLTDNKLIKVISGLGCKEDAEEIRKHTIRYNHQKLKELMRRGLKRNYC